MYLTIVAATKMEVLPLIQHFQASLVSGEKHYASPDDKIHVLITGMGMMQTATHLAIYAMKNDRDAYIDAGVAGAFNRDVKIGEVVHVISETYGDFGVEDGDEFKDFYDLGFLEKKEDEFDHGLLAPFGDLKNHPLLKSLRSATSLTVNKVHGKEETIAMIMKKYPADIENMEGLAFFNVLNELRKPCVEVRSISNYVERRNKENWDLPLSVKRLNEVLIHLVEQL